METLITLLFFGLLMILAVVLVVKIKDTFWFRMRQVRASAERRKEEDIKLAQKYSDRESEAEKLAHIEELENTGKTKIPYGSFDFMYRHYGNGKIPIFDNDGNLIYVDEERYKQLQNESVEIEKIEEPTNEKILIESEELPQFFSSNYVEITTADDGTITERNLIDKTITITTPKGEIYVNNAFEMMTIKSKSNTDDKNQNTKSSSQPTKDKKEQQTTVASVETISSNVSANVITEIFDSEILDDNTDEEEVTDSDNNHSKVSKTSEIPLTNTNTSVDNNNAIENSYEGNETFVSTAPKKSLKNKRRNKRESKTSDVYKRIYLESKKEVTDSDNNHSKVSKTSEIPLTNTKTSIVDENHTESEFETSEMYFSKLLNSSSIEYLEHSLSLNAISQLFLDLIINSTQVKVPMLFVDERSLYIDSAYFVYGLMQMSENSTFTHALLVNSKKEFYLNNENMLRVFDSINGLSMNEFGSSLIYIFDNSYYTSKKYYYFNNKLYNNSFIKAGLKTLESFNIDVSSIESISFIDKSLANGSYSITSYTHKTLIK